MPKNKTEENILDVFDFERTKKSKRKNRIRDFLDFDTVAYERLLREKDENFWIQKGQKRALKIFHMSAERVPAYKDFLKKHKVDHNNIRTFEHFNQVPITDKKNYIDAYELSDRCVDGTIHESSIIASSSGTTGEPKYWPRGDYQEFEAAVLHEMLYKYHFGIDKKKTLLIIGFPMGVYVSGIATAISSYLVSQKNRLSILTAGTSIMDILSTLRHINKNKSYDSIIIAGHPFFAKNIIEEIQKERSIKSMPIQLMLCSEGFSESWRKYVSESFFGSPYDIMSTYGASELLLIANETPLTIAIKKKAESNETMHKILNPDGGTWSFFQYNPFLRFIEEIRNELVFTALSGIPLVRYNLKDRGKIFGFKNVKNEFKLTTEFRHGANHAESLWSLPFLALAGRSDFGLVLYAANIYPEHIHKALSSEKFLATISGKFCMEKKYGAHMEQIFIINVELQNGIIADKKLSNAIREHTIKVLRHINMEYAFILEHTAKKHAFPKIILRNYRDPAFFPVGKKPKYVR